jgi:hypothetical protein
MSLFYLLLSIICEKHLTELYSHYIATQCVAKPSHVSSVLTTDSSHFRNIRRTTEVKRRYIYVNLLKLLYKSKFHQIQYHIDILMHINSQPTTNFNYCKIKAFPFSHYLLHKSI